MNIKNIATYALSFVLSATPFHLFADGTSPNKLCVNESYVLGFFNGVWNSEVDASIATFFLAEAIGAKFNGGIIAYDTFYNHSGSNDWFGGAQDVAETFIQRAEEIEPGFGEHFEVFWSVISSDADGFLQKVKNVIVSGDNLLYGLLADLYTEVTTERTRIISEILSNPPTLDDYKKHSTRIKSLAVEGNMLLLVAHSQGNLFVNKAYEAALEVNNYSTDNIGVVHIAPASSITYGPHILADLDLVINGLRAFGIGSVPSVTANIPATHLLVDKSGHTLIKTYLGKDLETKTQVINSLNSELDRLVEPMTEGITGSFTATLIWDGTGDIDLHTFEPTGSHVYHQNKIGDIGVLDEDNQEAYGPEHYFASCDPNILQTGTYQIGINNFANGDGITATLQVSTPYIADLLTRSIVLGAAEGYSGDNNPEILIEVQVSTNNEGVVNISANKK